MKKPNNFKYQNTQESARPFVRRLLELSAANWWKAILSFQKLKLQSTWLSLNVKDELHYDAFNLVHISYHIYAAR